MPCPTDRQAFADGEGRLAMVKEDERYQKLLGLTADEHAPSFGDWTVPDAGVP